MFRRLFLDHPADLGESYGEHARVAARFGAEMVLGGLACLVHAVVPAWFGRAGSGTVARLHARLVEKRGAAREAGTQARTVEWII